ncbi:YncE family protein [Candidatus Korobacter versatilis]|uniref:YncE family protein n=1 Tax=Candidatus Korobacter versatilis TaxID=658062 RepID=UPI00164FF068|nr:YncE family protein [Candidatus Koribacter versatilis]
MFSWKKAGAGAGVLCALLIGVGCSDTYRPIATAIVKPGGDPQPAKWVYAVYTNPTGTTGTPGPGTLQQIDVSGDSVAVNINVGTNPINASFLGTLSSVIMTVNQGAVPDSSEASITAQPVCNPQFTTCNPQPASSVTLPTGSIPTNVGSRQASLVYILASVAPGCPEGAVYAVNTSYVVANTTCVGNNPSALTQVPNAGRLYVINQGDNTVSVLDPVSQAVITTIPVGTNPVMAATDLSGKYVFVANKGSNNLTVITTSDNSTSTINVGNAPNYIIYSVRRNRLFVTNGGSNDVTVLDLSGSTPSVLKLSVPVGHNPTGVVPLIDGSRYYVANTNDNTVSVLDANSNVVVKTVSLGPAAAITQPLYIETEPTSTKIYVTTPAPPAGTAAANNPNDAPGITVIRTDTNGISNFIQAPQADPKCQVNPTAGLTCAYQVPKEVLAFPR